MGELDKDMELTALERLRIQTFPLGPLQTNAYLLYLEGGADALVIDPGMNPQPLLARLEQLGLHVQAILLTHAHFDHIGGVQELRQKHGCPVYIHSAEAEWLVRADLNGSLRWAEVTSPIACHPAEHLLEEGQTLELLGLSIDVLHTPGHSPGSVSFRFGHHLFGGDVLFRTSVGRTDLPGGDSEQLYDSIHTKLFVLDPDTVVYPGHGPRTTIGFEQEHNPFV